ncbi:PREDICTED: uncharacterized protein LOC109346962 [Lupinus angustifolius]|uniref:uncharacterized protein LOC109346962 n=1 Tax=Lupinus angustifolius TaxID=3871 RepID=UPI00092E8C12|nr:PREDICTED: uncharacterized protein LOC109346962 [Lupinus angustifolius]
MRQRQWIEFLKDYDFDLQYHPGKTNMVADALSRKSPHISTMMVKEMELIEDFMNLTLVVQVKPKSLMLGMLRVTMTFWNNLKVFKVPIQNCERREACWLKEEPHNFKKELMECCDARIESDSIAIDFVSEFPRTQKGYDAVWVIVDHLTKTTHFLPINKKYSLERLAEVYLKEIVQLHGIPKNIISDRDPRFTSKLWNGPYQILRKVGPVAYQIALPPLLSNLHNVFHVSQLKKYISDTSHIIEPDAIQLKDNLTFETMPIRIADRSVKALQGKEIALVKVV